MALSCFLLLRILRVAVSSNSGLRLLPLLCWNAINRWGFRKTHHFCHRSLEWMLCTFWTIVQFRHIFSFYYLSHLLRKDKPCALISAVLTCSGLQVSLALRSPHRCFLPLSLRPRRWLRPQTSHNSRVTPQSPSLSSLSTTHFPVNRNLSSMSLLRCSSIKHGNNKYQRIWKKNSNSNWDD